MPSLSKSQQQAAGMALAAKRGDMSPSELKGAAKNMYDSMSEKELEKYASTSHAGLPDKISEAIDSSVQSQIKDVLKKYNGKEVPDDIIHKIADDNGVSPHDVESYIYSLASAHLNESANMALINLAKKRGAEFGKKKKKRSPLMDKKFIMQLPDVGNPEPYYKAWKAAYDKASVNEESIGDPYNGWDPELLKMAKKYDRDEVNAGIKIEQEHNKDPETDVVGDKNDLLKIALAHLAEDPKYYTKLKKMESGDGETDESYSPSEYPQMRDPYRSGGYVPGTHISRNGSAPKASQYKQGPLNRKNLGRKRPRLKESGGSWLTELNMLTGLDFINESMERFALLYKTRDKLWYLDVADNEYGERDDATTYGPFYSDMDAKKYLKTLPNPGGYRTDRSGKEKAPTKSKNGKPIVDPSGGW